MSKTNYYYAEDDAKKRSKKKLIFAIIILAFSIILTAGIVAAYYSDMLEQDVNLTSSRLEIEGTYTFTLNGVSKTVSEITRLNPGDVIVVSGTITNIGNQSAWIREQLTFTTDDDLLYDYLEIYGTALTQTELLSATDYSQYAIGISEQGVAVSPNRVINGTGVDAQIESGGSYTYINSNTYNFSITIYFIHAAPNATQNKLFSMNVATQALQFVNNNASEPLESAWQVVSAVR